MAPLTTDGASSIVITGSPETEKEIRRIPEVYGRDKVKQDVGQELLSQVGIMCPEQDWRRIRLMGGLNQIRCLSSIRSWNERSVMCL